MTRLNNTRANLYAIMTVRDFVIEGISNIGSLRLDVGSLNALIAPNGYGKSNVLRAIGVGMDFLSATEQEKVQMMRSRFVPVNNNMYRKDFRFEILGSTMMDEQEISSQLALSAIAVRSDMVLNELEEVLDVKW